MRSPNLPEESLWICAQCGYQDSVPYAVCPVCKRDEDPNIGRLLAGTYRLTRKLAQGGMGSIYEAEHIRLKQKNKRAVKLLAENGLGESSVRRRFLREIEITHAVSQETEHIVRIHDAYGFENGVGYYVMELLEGEALSERLRKTPAGLPPLAWSREILLQICEAMDLVHRHGLVHRDLKPQNLFLVQKNAKDFVKVVDFGIAKPLEAATQLTLSASVIGTPLYMAPEQIQAVAGRPLDHRCDIYALGVIAYEIFTGRTPFLLGVQPSPMELHRLLICHLTEPPPKPSLYNPDLPRELEVLLLGMLEKDPDLRLSSMKEVADRLRLIEFSASSLASGRGFEAQTSLPFAETLAPASARFKPSDVASSAAPQEAVAVPPHGAVERVSFGKPKTFAKGEPLSLASGEIPALQKKRGFAVGFGTALLALLFGGWFWLSREHPPWPPSKSAGKEVSGGATSIAANLAREKAQEKASEGGGGEKGSVAEREGERKAVDRGEGERKAVDGGEAVFRTTENSDGGATSEVSAEDQGKSKGSEGGRKGSKLQPFSPKEPSLVGKGQPLVPASSSWVTIRVRLPGDHRLVIKTGKTDLQVKQGGRLLRWKKGRPSRVEVIRNDGQRLHVHPCVFSLPTGVTAIDIKPLTSADDFKPDTEDYCLVR